MAMFKVVGDAATAQGNYLTNLYCAPVWYGDLITSNPASMSLIGDNGFGLDCSGTFIYDSLGRPRGAVVDYQFLVPAAQGASGQYGGKAQFTITQLNGGKGFSAKKIFDFVSAGSTTEVLKYLLSRSDTLNGSGFDHEGIDEILYGWAGNDTISGVAGNDVIGGGSGKDHLIGGNGQDFFFFDMDKSRHADAIEDFGFGGVRDKIVLQQSAFSGLEAGALSEAQFAVGKVALDADDRILLNDNQVYYDRDGNGAAKAILVTTVKYAVVGVVGIPAITANDFQVVNSVNDIFL